MKKTALITGASSGLGVEFARNFAKDGHNLVLTARRTDRMNALADELRNKHGVRVDVLGKDLSDMDEVQSVFDTLQKEKIHIDFLVNNAGFGDFGEFHEAHWPKLEKMIDVNIKALTKLAHLFIKPMAEKGEGRIMNVSSLAGFQPGPLLAVYFATKAFVLSFSEAITNELKGTGVIVTTLCPGPTESEYKIVANLGNSKLFMRRKIPNAREVADYGYRKMMKGSMTAVPGLYNKFLATGYRFLPRGIILKVVRSLQERI